MLFPQHLSRSSNGVCSSCSPEGIAMHSRQVHFVLHALQHQIPPLSTTITPLLPLPGASSSGTVLASGLNLSYFSGHMCGLHDCHNSNGDAYVLHESTTPQTTYMASTDLNSREIVVILDLFILIDTTEMLPTSPRQPKVSSKAVKYTELANKIRFLLSSIS